MTQQKIADNQILSREEMTKLNKRRLKGDPEARLKMFHSNLGLVPRAVRRYFKEENPDFLDAIQEGRLGLLEAIDTYDHTRPNTFATHACGRIHYKVYARWAAGRLIKLPETIQKMIRGLWNATMELEQKFGRPVSDKEIAERLGLSQKKLETLQGYILSQVRLDAPSYWDHQEDKHSRIADSRYSDPSEVASLKDEGRDIVRQLLELRQYIVEHFDEDRQQIFCLRFGLFGQKPFNNREIGEIRGGVSREAIRQQCFNIFKRRAKQNLPFRKASEVRSATAGVRICAEAFVETGEEIPSEFFQVVYMD